MPPEALQITSGRECDASTFGLTLAKELGLDRIIYFPERAMGAVCSGADRGSVGLCRQWFGYNRDCKLRLQQMVIGLLCNRDGCPVGVEVFRGNTGRRHNG